MSDLRFIEKRNLEKLFEMGGGYVLDFSNRTFEEFVADSTGMNIYDTKYDYQSGSKANRLRAFWDIEPNYIAGKLIADLLEYVRHQGTARNDTSLNECCRIADRLGQCAPVPEIAVVSPQFEERNFKILQRAVRQSIENNEPEAGLDRLHTFMVTYMREVCRRRGIEIHRKKPLHSLVGEYLKCLRSAGLIESEMTERILKSAISTMEAFNHVRNNDSLAHPNPILSYNESLLIFHHVTILIEFIESIEDRSREVEPVEQNAVLADDDLPF